MVVKLIDVRPAEFSTLEHLLLPRQPTATLTPALDCSARSRTSCHIKTRTCRAESRVSGKCIRSIRSEKAVIPGALVRDSIDVQKLQRRYDYIRRGGGGECGIPRLIDIAVFALTLTRDYTRRHSRRSRRARVVARVCKLRRKLALLICPFRARVSLSFSRPSPSAGCSALRRIRHRSSRDSAFIPNKIAQVGAASFVRTCRT